MAASVVPDSALCRNCGYSLRGLQSAACPECGQAFDPADPKTMNLGRPLGWFGWLMLRPIGWPLTVLPWVIAGLLFWTSGLPSPTMHPSLVDVRWYLYTRGKWQLDGLEIHEQLYVVALYGLLLVLALWLGRWAGRAVTLLCHWRGARTLPRERARQFCAILGLAACTYLVGFGWPRRLGNLWTLSVLNYLKSSPNQSTAQNSGLNPRRPLGLSMPFPGVGVEDQLTALAAAIEQLPRVRQRAAGLKILIQLDSDATPEILEHAARRETDPEMQAIELRLMSLRRNPASIPLMERCLNSPHVSVRAAAADGLGILHSSRYLPETDAATWSFSCDTVDLSSSMRLTAPSPSSELPAGIRKALERQMLAGRTVEEREAAARALQPWPPVGYHLRLAEWGVWINQGGDLKLAQSVPDDIPPFVHRMSDPVEGLSDRLAGEGTIIINKPVLHVTADVPLALDLEVRINWGRPWVAFPRPDDYVVAAMVKHTQDATPRQPFTFTTQPPVSRHTLSPLDPPNPAAFQDAREGYPWLLPAHRLSGRKSRSFTDTGRNDFIAVGLRWQSLIVSPAQLPWMWPPVVADYAKYAWWSRLRQVPCSYVSSRGESERFLYYDGPTYMKAPLVV
ncbi:MAG: HEAT repeat domain-containing protein, partial [Tepidisphaerales bacterium]